MRHRVDSAGREKEGCILSRESVSSMNILLSAFLLITGVPYYGQHCCKPINNCSTCQKQDFFVFVPVFSHLVVLAPRGTEKGNMDCLMSLLREANQSSLFYCCNFYDNFKCVLAEIHWPPKNFDNVPGCC